MSKEEMHIEYAPEDRIDEDCYQFIEEIAPMEDGGPYFISNESLLEEFLPEEEIPGHDWRPLSQVPEQERGYYLSHQPHVTDPNKFIVYYPPMTKEERQQERQRVLNRLEITYGVSFAEFPAEERLYVWKIVAYLRARGVQFIPEGKRGTTPDSPSTSSTDSDVSIS